jgi:hypothetical protein
MYGSLSQETVAMLKGLRKDVTTSGLLTTTNLNFYNLEPLARRIYPVLYPLLASIPRVNSPNAGSGTAVHWKAIVAADTQFGGYPGISEGNRNATMNLTERDYVAAFKYLGKDIFTTFQAQYGAEGFDDAVGQANINMLNSLLNSEERMILYGNSGTNGNGFQLGTTPTPTIVGSTSGGTITTGQSVTVACIALTGWGYQMASTTGVQAPFVRTNADGSQDTINGGTAAISALSSAYSTTTNLSSVAATVAAVRGALGYAWYVSVGGTLATAYFYGLSTIPKITITTNPVNTNQAGNATGLNADNSANALDFDGLLTWCTGNSATNAGGYWQDLGGAGLTANGDGTIAEFETVLKFLWTNYKLAPDALIVGGTLIGSITKAILAGGGTPIQRLMFESNNAGRLIGGTLATTYRSKYQGGQAKDLAIEVHPWLPDGCVFFDTRTNPYPGSNIPAVRRIMTMADHFTIHWALRTLKWEVGTYCFETLEHYIPFATALLTGIAPTAGA